MDEGNNFIPLSDKINDDGSSPISGAPSNREENPSSRPKSRNKGPVQTEHKNHHSVTTSIAFRLRQQNGARWC